MDIQKEDALQTARNMATLDKMCQRFKRYREIDNHLWRHGLGRFSVNREPLVTEGTGIRMGDQTFHLGGQSGTPSPDRLQRGAGETRNVTLEAAQHLFSAIEDKVREENPDGNVYPIIAVSNPNRQMSMHEALKEYGAAQQPRPNRATRRAQRMTQVLHFGDPLLGEGLRVEENVPQRELFPKTTIKKKRISKTRS